MEDGMVKIWVTDREGSEHELDAPTDMNLNLMEVMKMYELPVKATCGGMAMCATCQVYIDDQKNIPEISDAELDMLDEAFFVEEERSRLGCQIKITEKVDGLKITLAPAEEED
jgi:2Fe-2S ferredoxin